MRRLVVAVALTASASALASATSTARGDIHVPTSEITRMADPPKVVGSSTSTNACASCHESITREWEESKHHRSASNTSYKSALAREPLAFCRGCHAPNANAEFATPFEPREEGIGCTNCHEGLSATHSEQVRKASQASKSATRACATCHEFKFPSGQAGQAGLMQLTQREHEHSAYAETKCASCHMKSSSTAHTNHRFDVEPLLPQAMTTEVTRASATRVAFRLRPNEIGHAFPTGDLYRRLRVRASVAALDLNVPGIDAEAERYLARHLVTQLMPNGQHAKTDGIDDRVGAKDQPSCFELDLGPRAKNRAIDVEIALERVEQPRSARDSEAEVSARLGVWKSVIASAVTDDEFKPCLPKD